MRTLLFAALLLFPSIAAAADKPPILSPKEIADGWIMLFDGESTFGWKIDGESEVKDGKLILGGKKETKAVCTLRLGAVKTVMDSERWGDGQIEIRQGPVTGTFGKGSAFERATVATDTY